MELEFSGKFLGYINEEGLLKADKVKKDYSGINIEHLTNALGTLSTYNSLSDLIKEKPYDFEPHKHEKGKVFTMAVSKKWRLKIKICEDNSPRNTGGNIIIEEIYKLNVAGIGNPHKNASKPEKEGWRNL